MTLWHQASTQLLPIHMRSPMPLPAPVSRSTLSPSTRRFASLIGLPLQQKRALLQERLSNEETRRIVAGLDLVTLRSCDRHLGQAIGATARGSDAMSGSPTPLMDTKTSPARLRPLAKPFRSRSLSSAEWHVARMRLTTYPRRHASEGSEPTWLDRRDDHAVLLRGLNTGRQAKVLWSQLEA